MWFNEYRAAQLNGSAAPGYSTFQSMKALEETFGQTMPAQLGFDYAGISFQEKKAQEGVSSGVIFEFSLLFVFLILAQCVPLRSATSIRRSEGVGSETVSSCLTVFRQSPCTRQRAATLIVRRALGSMCCGGS